MAIYQKDITLSEKQNYTYNLLTNDEPMEVCYGGGARGGKTFLGSFWVISSALKYQGSRWLIGRQSLKTLRLTTLVTFFDVLRLMDLKRDRDFHYNASDGVFTFKIGGTFEGGSMVYLAELANRPEDPNFDRLGSYDLTGYWIDEAQEVSLKAKDTLHARLSLLQGEGWDVSPKALFTNNPSKGWIYSDFWKPLVRDGKNIKGKEFVTALYKDNPWVAHNKYKNNILGTRNKVIIERLLNGNFEYDNNDLLLYDYDALNDMFTNAITVDNIANNRYIIADVARFGRDKTVIGYFEGLKLKVVNEYQTTDTEDVKRLLREFSVKYQVPYSNILVDENGVGGGVKDGMRGIKGFMGQSTPIDEHGDRPNYANLRSQCYFKLAEAVNSHKFAIEIDNEKEVRDEIIQDLYVMEQKDPAKYPKLAVIGKDDIKEKLGRSPDYGDMLSMRMYFELDGTGSGGILFG